MDLLSLLVPTASNASRSEWSEYGTEGWKPIFDTEGWVEWEHVDCVVVGLTGNNGLGEALTRVLTLLLGLDPRRPHCVLSKVSPVDGDGNQVETRLLEIYQLFDWKTVIVIEVSAVTPQMTPFVMDQHVLPLVKMHAGTEVIVLGDTPSGSLSCGMVTGDEEWRKEVMKRMDGLSVMVAASTYIPPSLGSFIVSHCEHRGIRSVCLAIGMDGGEAVLSDLLSFHDFIKEVFGPSHEPWDQLVKITSRKEVQSKKKECQKMLETVNRKYQRVFML